MAEETEVEQFEHHAGRTHYYNAAKNPDGAYLAGVPMRDLAADEWDALSAQQRRDALYHGYWRLTPVPRAADEPDAEAAPAEEAPAPRRRAARVEVEVAPDTAGSNAAPTPDAAPPNPVGALEPASEVNPNG